MAGLTRLRMDLMGAVAVLSMASVTATAAPPPEGECPTISVSPQGDSAATDAAPIALKEGMVIDRQNLLVLRKLIPAEIWRHREVFFHEGMRMEIGPCHRRYAVPTFFREATAEYASRVRLDKDANLRNHVVGLPFPPESIDPEGEDAAVRWAWNFVHRYRGAGHAGSFRITDFPDQLGGIETYEGSFFLLQTQRRADLADNDYHVPEAKKKLWAAGGRFSKPFNARHLAWRQFRPLKTERDYLAPDDTFVYVPTMRKARRAATSWIDGLFFPSYSVSGDSGGGGLPIGTGTGAGSGFGEGLGGGIGTINPTAGDSIAATIDRRRGLTGLELRPNAYIWRMRGEQELLAPLNGTRQGYPGDPYRNFGRSGLSVASDRWEVRQAVVIEGALRKADETIRTVTIYLDYQTQQPLYWITRTDRRRLVEIGILTHRFTGDVIDYPEWPGGRLSEVFEPVAQVFFNALTGSGGWRRESYDLVSLPFDRDERRRMTSMDGLSRGH